MSVIVYGICMSDDVYVHVPPKVKPEEVHVDLRSTYMYMYTITNHGTVHVQPEAYRYSCLN